MARLVCFLFSIFFLLLGGCSFTESTLESLLINQGPIAVSPSDPDVTSNAYLIKEAQTNSNLTTFLANHHYPDFLELKNENGLLLKLFYLNRGIYYPLQKKNDFWFISREESIDSETKTKLSSFAPTTLEESTKKTVSEPSIVNDEPELKEEKDIIHTVKYPGETLDALAQWYTEDKDNGRVLGRINDIQDVEGALPIGKTVRIPSYLIKKGEVFPQRAVTAPDSPVVAP